MSDVVDEAQTREAAHLERSLSAQQQAAALGAAGRERCEDCGAEIPANRRAALPSATRCVDCQQWLEHVSRMHPR